MTALYKYRPLNDFLFKELHYQELYFASYHELNDPLDLSAGIDFRPNELDDMEILSYFIFKSSLKIFKSEINNAIRKNNEEIISHQQNKILMSDYNAILFRELSEIANRQSRINFEDLERILIRTKHQIKFEIDIEALKNEIERLTTTFLECSYITSFSETNNDFLMWSHYASKHSGICLEFSLDNGGAFPFIFSERRKMDLNEYFKKISYWNIEETIFWDGLEKVSYKKEPPAINFFEFSPIFINEDDLDVLELAKTWTHKFAYELKHVFSIKTMPWEYEKEWRAIQINFKKIREPEGRIMHYPIECLTGVYFGLRTPDEVKKRIYRIFDNYKDHRIKFYSCIPNYGKDLKFEVWNYYED